MQYLQRLQVEPEYDVQTVAYIKVLEAVKKAQQVFYSIFFSGKTDVYFRATSNTLSNPFINFGTEDFTTVGNLSKSSNAKAKLLEAEQTRSHWRLLVHMNHADETKQQLGVKEQWTPEDPCHVDALKYINNWTFICAVECLEGLVVQRLFELSKAILAATGMYPHFIAAKALN